MFLEHLIKAFKFPIKCVQTDNGMENLYKIKSSYLKIKYLILKDIDALDTSTIQAELQTELDKIECSLDEEESSLNQEITYDADT